jgi:thioredoxin-dependent peroxiredoxin
MRCGKWVVLYFYPKDFTSGCTTEEFCTQEGLNFKLPSDSDHKVSEEYGSIMNLGVKKLSARHTFIISPDGVIVQEFLEVNPSKRSEELLAALTELQKT